MDRGESPANELEGGFIGLSIPCRFSRANGLCDTLLAGIGTSPTPREELSDHLMSTKSTTVISPFGITI